MLKEGLFCFISSAIDSTPVCSTASVGASVSSASKVTVFLQSPIEDSE